MYRIYIGLIVLLFVLQVILNPVASATSYNYSTSIERSITIHDFYMGDLGAVDNFGNLYLVAYTYPSVLGLVQNPPSQTSLYTIIKVDTTKNVEWCKMLLNGTWSGTLSLAGFNGTHLFLTALYPSIYVPNTVSVNKDLPYLIIMDLNGKVEDVKVLHLSNDYYQYGTANLTLWYSFSVRYKNGFYYFAGLKGGSVIVGKADTNFNVLWVRKLSIDMLNTFYVDDQGYIYLGGEIPTGTDVKAGYLVKIDPTGNVLWARKVYIGKIISGVGAIDEYLGKIIFVMGTKDTGGRHDIYVGKLNNDGTVVWVKNITFVNATIKWAQFDNQNGYIILGGTTSNGKMFLIYFDTDLKQVNSVFYKDPAPSTPIYLKGLRIIKGSTYIYGNIVNSTSLNSAFDILFPEDVEKLKTSGTVTYTVSTLSSDIVSPLSISVSNETGWFEPAELPIVSCNVKVPASVSYEVQLLDPEVMYEYGGLSSVKITAPSINSLRLFDNGDDIALLAEMQNGSSWKPLVALFSTSGSLEKAYLANIPIFDVLDAVLASNTMYILAPSADISSSVFYVVKLSLQDGAGEVWKVNVTAQSSNQYYWPFQILVDSDGSVYVVLICESLDESTRSYSFYTYIVAFTSNGAIKWIREIEGIGMATLLNSNLYIALEDIYSYTNYLVKMSANGDLLSSVAIQTSGNYYSEIVGVYSDVKNIYLAIKYNDSTALLAFDENLAFQWSRNITDMYYSYYSIKPDNGNLIMIGKDRFFVIGSDGTLKATYKYPDTIIDAVVVNNTPVALGGSILYFQPSTIEATLPSWNKAVSTMPAQIAVQAVPLSSLYVTTSPLAVTNYASVLASSISAERSIIGQTLIGKGLKIKMLKATNVIIKVSHPYAKQINETTYDVPYAQLAYGKVTATLPNGSTVVLGSILTHPKFVLYANTTIMKVTTPDPYTIKITFSSPALVSIASSDNIIESIIKDGSPICKNTTECSLLRDSDKVITFDPTTVTIKLLPPAIASTNTRSSESLGGRAEPLITYHAYVALGLLLVVALLATRKLLS